VLADNIAAQMSCMGAKHQLKGADAVHAAAKSMMKNTEVAKAAHKLFK